MLYAVSGSQGSGKSSVLRALEKQGYNVLSRKVSRSILTDWNVELEEVNRDLSLSVKFQNELIKRKRADEEEVLHTNEIWFTERTYMDSFVYYLFSFGKMESLKKEITAYYDTCSELSKKYDGVFYLPSGKFPTVVDGVRCTNPYYVESVDMLLKHYTMHVVPNAYEMDKYDSVEERVDFVKKVIKKTEGLLINFN